MNDKEATNTYLSTAESKQQNKQAEQKQITDTENFLMVARWEGGQGVGKKGEGIEKYKLVVIE